MDFLNKHPLLLPAIAFVTGCLWGAPASILSIAGLIISLVMLLLSLGFRKFMLPHQILFYLSIFSLFLFLGLIRNCLSMEKPENHVSRLREGRYILNLRALGEANSTENGRKMRCEVLSVLDQKCSAHPASGNLFFFTGSGEELPKTGDTLQAEGLFRKIVAENSSYRKYLRRHDLNGYIFSDGWMIRGRQHSDAEFIAAIRNSAGRILQRKITDSTACSVAQAMLLGNKSGLETEVRADFARAGVAHILAISGLHVGLLFVSLQNFLRHIAGRFITKNMIILLALLLLIFYAVLTGLSPAVCRAVLMFGIMSFSRLVGRGNQSLNGLSAACLLLLFIDPGQIQMVGFQLSFCAVAGIIILTPWISGFLSTQLPYLPAGIISTLSASLAAQFSTCFLIWNLFHTFPVYFLLSNLLILPLAAITVRFGFLLLLTGYIPLLGDIAAWITEKSVLLIFNISTSISNFEGSVISRLSLSDASMRQAILLLGLVSTILLLIKLVLRKTVGKLKPRFRRWIVIARNLEQFFSGFSKIIPD